MGLTGHRTAGAKAGVCEIARVSELSANNLVLSTSGEHLKGFQELR